MTSTGFISDTQNYQRPFVRVPALEESGCVPNQGLTRPRFLAMGWFLESLEAAGAAARSCTGVASLFSSTVCEGMTVGIP